MKDPRLEKDKGKGERRLLLGFVFPSCAAEFKLFLTAFLLLCSLATVVQFLPATFSLYSSTSSSDLTSCNIAVANATATATATTLPPPLPPPTQPPPLQRDQLLENGSLKRSFNPVGTAAYNFILMSAYRGGDSTFAVLGLASKPLHSFGHPTYTCEYQTAGENSATVTGRTILPDWGYGKVYTTVVINCTFPKHSAVSDSTSAGRLLIHASTNGGFDTELNLTDTIEALIESPSSWNTSQFADPPTYDYLYCGSPLYGNLSPQRMREWIAYHVRLFGGRSHFVIYDAGGIHPEVMEVLRPWMELGYVSLHDIREQERFDAYYHNQFLVVNDCLHRYRFSTKWMFFFDVDEYIFIDSKHSIGSVMEMYDDVTQITISQMLMSSKLCVAQDAGRSSSKWAFEKLVYRDMKKVARRDRKYAVQPRNVLATGVHLSKNFVGKSTHGTDKYIRYFHYHGTIAYRQESCREFVNGTSMTVDKTPYVLVTVMRSLAPTVKNFEINMIGSRLKKTQQ